jgi:hypothetical protein
MIDPIYISHTDLTIVMMVPGELERIAAITHHNSILFVGALEIFRFMRMNYPSSLLSDFIRPPLVAHSKVCTEIEFLVM